MMPCSRARRAATMRRRDRRPRPCGSGARWFGSSGDLGILPATALIHASCGRGGMRWWRNPRQFRGRCRRHRRSLRDAMEGLRPRSGIPTAVETVLVMGVNARLSRQAVQIAILHVRAQ